MYASLVWINTEQDFKYDHKNKIFQPCILDGVDLGDSRASCHFSGQSVLYFFHASTPCQRPHPSQSTATCACQGSWYYPHKSNNYDSYQRNKVEKKLNVVLR